MYGFKLRAYNGRGWTESDWSYIKALRVLFVFLYILSFMPPLLLILLHVPVDVYVWYVLDGFWLSSVLV